MSNKALDWNNLRNEEIKELKNERFLFIAAPIAFAKDQLKGVIPKLEKKGKVVLGISKDNYVDGLLGEQFKMLSLKDSEDLPVQKIEYYQRDLKYIFKELNPSAAIFINGSWSRSLHLHEELWTLLRKKVEYKLISPFVNEKAAKLVSQDFEVRNSKFEKSKYNFLLENNISVFNLIDEVKSESFDWTGQVGAVLVKDRKVIAVSFNRVVPYHSYSMHFGSSRESNFSPPGDQNYYDTNHAEVEMVLKCMKENIDMKDSTLYINILPCPTCARMLSKSGITEVVYQHDHTDGYAAKLFKESGIKASRYVE